MRYAYTIHASAASPRGRRLQVRDHGERQNRHCIGEFHSSTLRRNRATCKKVVRVCQRKRFRKFDYCVFPALTDRRKTNVRRKSRCDYNNPFVFPLSAEADAAFRECATRRQRQIFSMLKKLSMLSPKLRDALR